MMMLVEKRFLEIVAIEVDLETFQNSCRTNGFDNEIKDLESKFEALLLIERKAKLTDLEKKIIHDLKFKVISEMHSCMVLKEMEEMGL